MRTDLGPGHSRLKPPAVVGEGVVFPPIQGYLHPLLGARQEQRKRYRSFLRPPTVTTAPQPFVAAPVAVTLAPSPRQGRAPHPNLAPPVVIDLSPQVKYVTVSLAYSRRGIPKSVLRKPTDTVGLEDQGRIKVRLAPSPKQARAPHSRLRPPAVIDLTPQTKYLFVGLAYSRRGAPKSRLGKPTVVLAPPIPPPIATSLAYSLRGRTMAGIRPPRFVGAGITFRPVQVHLSPSSRRGSKSRLSPPTVTAAVAVYRGPKLNTVRRPSRPVGQSVLGPPTVVSAVAAFGGIGVQFVQTPRTRTQHSLRPPATVTAAVTAVYSGPQTHLVRAYRVTARSVLGVPRVVFVAVEIYGPTVALTRIRPPSTLAILRPPTDTVGLEDQGRIKIRLAPSPRQPRKTDYKLAPPVVIDLHPQTVYLAVSLTYSRRGKARYGLAAPAVVFIEAPPLARPLLVHLAYPLRKPGEALLRKPTVVGPVLARPILVHLAYSRRGRPLSVLRKPTVIDLRPQAYYLAVTLAPSRRGRPLSELKPPAVVEFKAVFLGPSVTLAASRRGVSESHLRPPVVIDLRPQVYYLRVELTRIKHPPTQSFLRPSQVTEALPKAERDLRVTLTYSRRGRPKSVLRKPTVIDLRPQTRFLSVTLTYSRRGQPRSELKPPTVVGRLPFAPVAVALAYSRRGRAKPFRTVPTVVRPPFVATPVTVHLAYSLRGKPRSLLRPPVLAAETFAGPFVHLAPSRFPKARYGLAPPAIVGAGIAFFGPQTTLVRIVPPPVEALLKRPTVVNTFIPPAGDVCGTDEPAADDCGTDQPVTDDVCGTDEPAFDVSGSDSPESRIVGSDTAVGDVCGTDEQST